MVSKEEHVRLEQEFNVHTMYWTNMLDICGSYGDKEKDRFRSAMLSHNSAHGKLYMFRKDHKACEDNHIGPPVRPLCDMSDAYNHRLSYLVSTILSSLTEYYDTQCDSTEGMLASIKVVNDEGAIGANTVLGSLDVKSLYPSLDIPFVIDIVCLQFDESGFTIEGVDYEEVGLYLCLNRKVEYLRVLGLSDYCPTRRDRLGRPPTMTSSGSKTKKKDRFGPWNRAMVQVEGETRRVMLSEALKIAL